MKYLVCDKIDIIGIKYGYFDSIEEAKDFISNNLFTIFKDGLAMVDTVKIIPFIEYRYYVCLKNDNDFIIAIFHEQEKANYFVENKLPILCKHKLLFNPDFTIHDFTIIKKGK